MSDIAKLQKSKLLHSFCCEAQVCMMHTNAKNMGWNMNLVVFHDETSVVRIFDVTISLLTIYVYMIRYTTIIHAHALKVRQLIQGPHKPMLIMKKVLKIVQNV